jgi:hypothetical protein
MSNEEKLQLLKAESNTIFQTMKSANSFEEVTAEFYELKRLDNEICSLLAEMYNSILEE